MKNFRILVYLLGTYHLVVGLLGGIFKIMHWPGANEMIICTGLTGIFYIPFASLYLYFKRKES